MFERVTRFSSFLFVCFFSMPHKVFIPLNISISLHCTADFHSDKKSFAWAAAAENKSIEDLIYKKVRFIKIHYPWHTVGAVTDFAVSCC